MKNILLFLLCFPVFGQTITLTDDDIKAVPFAQGFAQDATGGRGGTNVWKVTNRNSNGPGSLDAALRSIGDGYIIFDVAGVIRHSGEDFLLIDGGSGSKTIDFATAPGEGISLQGAELRIQESNIILRNARIRLGPNGSTGSNVDCINLSTFDGPINNVYIDRASLYYSLDENLSTVGSFSSNAGISNVTVANSIIAHAGFCTLIFKESTQISLINSISCFCDDRDFYSSTHQSSREVVNNIVYDPGETFNVTAGETHDLIGNQFILMSQVSVGANNATYYLRHNVNTTNSPTQTLADSNIFRDNNVFDTSNYSGVALTGNISPNYTNNERTTKNYTTGNFTPAYPSNEVLTRVLSTTQGAGSKPWDRDAIDQKVIDDISTRSNAGGRITSPTYANSSHFQNPNASSRPAGFDTDNDGLPDAYETINSNPVSTDRFVTMNLPDGRVIDQSQVQPTERFTYLEGYLYDLNNDWDRFQQQSDSQDKREEPLLLLINN